MVENREARQEDSKTDQKTGNVRRTKRDLAKLEHYRTRVAENEERLRTGIAADGTPLTELQRTNLQSIVELQLGHVLELSA